MDRQHGIMADSAPVALDAVAGSHAWRGARAWHWQMLALAVLVGLLAIGLRVLPDRQRIAIRGFEQYPMPHVCALRTWLGLKCPACGLTRSMVYLAHADVSASVQAHRFGWLIALLIAAQVPYRLLSLRRVDRPLLGSRPSTILGLALVGLFVSNWIVDLIFFPVAADPTAKPNTVQLTLSRSGRTIKLPPPFVGEGWGGGANGHG